MTIRKGEEWGVRVMCPEEREIAEDDFDASRHDSSSVFSVIRGDLHLSLGSPKVPIIGHECTAVPIDALRCTVTAPSGEQRDLFARGHSSFYRIAASTTDSTLPLGRIPMTVSVM